MENESFDSFLTYIELKILTSDSQNFLVLMNWVRIDFILPSQIGKSS